MMFKIITMKTSTSLFNLFFIFLITFVKFLYATQEQGFPNDSYVDFMSQPQNTVNNKSIPIILNCTIGIYFANTTTYSNGTLPANVTWFRNDVLVNNNNLFPREYLFSNGSFKVYPRTYRISNIRNSDVYQCQARYKNLMLLSRKAEINVARLISPKQPTRFSISSCVGSTIHLNCSFGKSNPPPVINWYKSGRLLGSNEEFSFKRVENVFSNAVGKSTVILPSGGLEIVNLNSSDAGKYTCFGQNVAGKKKGFQYTLTVTNDCPSLSTPHFLTQPQSQSLLLGEVAMLECAASGGTNLVLKWFKNTTELNFKNNEKYHVIGQGSLRINELDFQDSGRYSCFVEAPNTTPLVASARISVLDLPRFSDQLRHTRTAYVGCQVSFHCDVTGWPLPTVTWYKNGNLLVPSDDILFENNSLSMRVTSLDDAKAYQCFVENDADKIQASFQLKVLQENLDGPEQSDVLNRDATPHLVSSAHRRGTIVTLRSLSASLNDLKLGHTFRVVVIPSTALCDGPPSKAITFKLPNRQYTAGLVRNLAVEALSSTGIWVTWSPPSDSESEGNIKYKIVMQETNLSADIAKEGVTADTSQEYQGLKKYTSYNVKVAVLSEDGEVGPYTEPVALRTLEDIPDDPPLNLTVRSQGVDSVTIAWSPPPPSTVNGEIRGYNVRYKDLVTRKSTVLNLDGIATEHIITGLQKNAEYSMKIQVRNGRGSSVWSKKVFFETSQDPKLETRAPGKPSLLDTQRGSTEIMVMWTPPNDDVIVREYEIGWGESGPYEHVDKTDESQRYYRITNLVADAEYFISVRAGNQAGQGEEYHIAVRTKAFDDMMDELYPPLNVHVSVLTHTTLNVTWLDNEHKQEGRYYLIRYKTNVPEEPRVRFINSSDVACIIHGLRPYTVYYVSVRVVDSERQSTWSMTETARTKESKPGTPPTDLTLMPVESDSGTSVQLNWQPPTEPNGELTGYLVFYTTNPSHDIGRWVIEPVLGDKLSTTVKGLTEDTHYYFKALARNQQGVGPYSEVVKYHTPITLPSVDDLSTPLNLSKPVWYLIIGGAVLLLVIVVIVVAVIVYRKKRSKNNWSFRRGKRLSEVNRRPINGVRSPSSTSWALSGNSTHSHPSTRFPMSTSKQFEMHSLQSPMARYPDDLSSFCPNGAPPEVIPLNDPQYRYDYQCVPGGSPLHDPLRMPPSSGNMYSLQGDRYNQETDLVPIQLQRDPASEMGRYPDYHIPHHNTSPKQLDPTGDSAYGSDHQHCHIADEPHHEEVFLRQNQYLQSDSTYGRCDVSEKRKSSQHRSSSLSMSPCSTNASGTLSSLDSDEPALRNVQLFLDDMRSGSDVM